MPIFEHPGFSAKVVADSVSPTGKRLTTLEVVFPRMILSEFNTHRMLSKNSASSRAIPVVKQIRKIMDYPYIPNTIGINQSGMQATSFLTGADLIQAQQNVIVKRDRTVIGALEDLVGPEYVRSVFGDNLSEAMVDGFRDEDFDLVEHVLNYYSATAKEDEKPEGFLNIHKQTVNRYLEPFMWHTVVVTATEWSNFFALRIHGDAQPEICLPTELIRNAMNDSTPTLLNYGEWHLPFVQDDEKHLITPDTIENWKYVSSGRCARVSYETHDGKRDIVKDIELAKERLVPHGHMSPLEHVATPVPDDFEGDTGNLKGWLPFRKEIPFEDNYEAKLSSM
ncbi:MAG: FAD-dependent thymidylate synthase [Enterococcus sp.]|nr:FAD-dependent thymidylate synthase [Enterococcus sp.]